MTGWYYDILNLWYKSEGTVNISVRRKCQRRDEWCGNHYNANTRVEMPKCQICQKVQTEPKKFLGQIFGKIGMG